MIYKIEPLRCRVRVKHYSDPPSYYNAITEAEAVEITEWVTERDMGKRISYDIWKLKSRACVTAFLLHWGTK
jgi:hypothetical protein